MKTTTKNQIKALELIKNSFPKSILLNESNDFLQSYEFFKDAKNNKFVGLCFGSHYFENCLCVVKFFPSNNINIQDQFIQDFIDNGTTFYVSSVADLETILNAHERQALKAIKHLAA